MSAKYWIKLYIEILDDPKMGRLSERLCWRSVQLFLMAGDNEKDGALPTVRDIAWRLRKDVQAIEKDLLELEKVGIVHQCDNQWCVTNFKKRQKASENAERVREFRKRQRNEIVTKRYARNAPESEEESDTESEERRFPTTPREANNHPDIKVFHNVSKVFPGEKDYSSIIDSIRILREKHPSDLALESYLLPFWLRWETSKTKDGRTFSKTNPAWLTEWAVNNYIPDPKKNGHEPQQKEYTYLEVAT